MATPAVGNDPLIATQVLQYRIIARLGQGSFGTVYRGERISLSDISDNESCFAVVAIKCIERHRLSRSGRDNLVSEIATLKKVSHPNIVRLVDFWWDHSRVYLLTEFCAGGDLSAYLRKHGALTESVVQKMAFQLVDALGYLHSLDIVHLDIKPLNILLTGNVDPDVKLADFGFARNLVEPTKALVGSLLYMAPEMVRSGVIDKRADIWSLGVVFYELVYGVPLFASKTEEELVTKLTDELPIHLPLTPRVSASFRDMLFHLLQRLPEERLSMADLQSHAFVNAGKPRRQRPTSDITQTAQHQVPSTSRGFSLPAPVKPKRTVDSRTLDVAKSVSRARPDCVDQVARALFAMEQAMDAEQQNDWPRACKLYTEAVEIFLPIHKSIRQDSRIDNEVKGNLRKVIDVWLKRGEDAKRNVGRMHTAPSFSCTSLPVAPNRNNVVMKPSVDNSSPNQPSLLPTDRNAPDRRVGEQQGENNEYLQSLTASCLIQ